MPFTILQPIIINIKVAAKLICSYLCLPFNRRVVSNFKHHCIFHYAFSKETNISGFKII